MTWSGNKIARRASGRVELRPDALRLRMHLRDIATADVHLIDVEFTCSVRALDQRGEREMFAETFLTSRDSTSAEDIAVHFSPALQRALCAFSVKRPAAELLEETGERPIIDALMAAAKPVAFGSGVELLPPFDVVVTSRTVQREQFDALEQKLAERRLAGQIENVQRANELLREFDALRQAMPGLSPGRLLEQIVPANRGSMLQSLLMASSSGAVATLWAVAGPNLLKIDPRVTPAKIETIPLPTDLGPLRSVRGSRGRLLVGAQSGVMIVDPDHPADAVLYRDDGVTSQLGFNSVAQAGDLLWASHSDAGLAGWTLDKPDRPIHTARPRGQEPGARNATPFNDSMILYTVGGNVLGADSTCPRIPVLATGRTPVIALAVEHDKLLVVFADGTIDRMRHKSFEALPPSHRGGEISAAGVLPLLDSTRLLLASADGSIQCVGDDDPLVTQFQSPHRGLRAVTACADIVAALSADRQRIILWNSWAGESPLGEIHVAALARHRAADLCFA